MSKAVSPRDRAMAGLLAVVVGWGAALAVGFLWGLPGSDSWAADSISPRSCGLGAIVETYWPGHFHTYPPLHMALLTLLSLPWMTLAWIRSGPGLDALSAELIKPLTMTAVEVSARLVAAAMGTGVLWNTLRLWRRIEGRRAGVMACAVVGANATLVYYAHTGNLEVPYLFWLSWTLVELDRVMCGERREGISLLLASAAILTKDQAAAALLLPLPWAMGVVPWLVRCESPIRGGVVRGILASGAAIAIASGALVNPTGFRRRVAFLLGPASQTWAGYPRGFRGALALFRDALRATPHFSSWALAAAACVGLVLAIRRPGLQRWRAVTPALASLSFAFFFTFSARRSEDRFLLPESVFLLPYAAAAFDALCAWSRARAAGLLVFYLSLVPAIVSVVALDATLITDTRYDAERYLGRLPAGTHVEVVGGPIFLPRIPDKLIAVRPGIEPISSRQAIAGVTDIVDPAMDPRSRAPEVIVLSSELSSDAAGEPPPASRPYALMQYGDATSHAFVHGLASGALGYERTLRAVCHLPWPLQCHHVHGSTGEEIWVYRRMR